jgi:GNAT superfamily N-acetyltransferase
MVSDFMDHFSKPSMSEQVINYRDATLKDSVGIGQVHVRSWQESYDGIISSDHLKSLNPVERAKMWEERFLDPKYDGHAIIAEDSSGVIIGFAGIGPARTAEFTGQGEIRAIYLLNQFKGKGIGRRLFQLGEERIRALGFQQFYCWVLKGNPTCRFYERMGGLRTSQEKIIKIGLQDLTEVSYQWNGPNND